METTNYKCNLKRWNATAKTLREKMIRVGNSLETPANSFLQFSLALACKLLSERTSCTHLLSTASAIHSRG